MRLLVFGAGVSGLAVTRLARRHGHAVTVYDQATIQAGPLLEVGVGVVTGRWEAGLLDGIDLVVTSPGFSERSLPVVETLEAGVPIWSEVEYAWRRIGDRPVVGITGTNGKTTVTRLTTAMLTDSGVHAVAAGNIGTALSDVAEDDWDVAVVEVSSFQLRFIDRFHPASAGLLNLAVDHLDWHGSSEAYAAAKKRIFERQTEEDLLVFDADDPGASTAVRQAAAILHPVSASHRPQGGSGVEAGELVLPALKVPVDDLGSADPAHLVDMAAAAVLALDRGAEPEAVAAALRDFRPAAHRRAVTGSWNGITFVDDSKATNPHAALAAVSAYPSVILIAGGLSKGLDLAPLARARNVVAVVGIGTAGPQLAEAAGGRGHTAATMDEAVDRAASLARPGDTVLLAPGAASFDQYRSYSERGDSFVAAVRRLQNRDTP